MLEANIKVDKTKPQERSAIELLGLIHELVAENVNVGITKTFFGNRIEIEYQTPTGDAFKRATITMEKSSFSMSHHRLMDSQWRSEGYSHITREGHLMETIWREFGQNVSVLLKFFDKRPDLKAQVI